MGSLHKLNQGMKKAIRQSRMGRLSNEIQRLHAETLMQPWQTERVKEIRAAYEVKLKVLEDKHNELRQSITEEFMEHEIEFIRASTELRKNDPTKEWHPDMVGKLGYFARSNWKKLTARAEALGISYGDKKQTT